MSQTPEAGRRLWPLLVVPALILALGVGIVRLDAFADYRGFAGRETVPETLLRSGRTAQHLNLLDYRPLKGLSIPGFDPSLPVEQMPSTTTLDPKIWQGGTPVISVVADSEDLLNRDTGLIANPQKKGRSWERPVYVTYFRDGKAVWNDVAGLRVHGAHSRSQKEKSFRLYFRSMYGAESVPHSTFFGGADTPMKSLVIHNDVRFRDDLPFHYLNPISYEVARKLGSITSATVPVQYYLNGVHQGPYVLKEHIGAEFMVSRFGHDRFFLADVKPADRDSPMRLGSHQEYREFQEWPLVQAAPLTIEQVETRFDLENMTNWIIGVVFLGTTDPFQGAVARDLTKPGSRWFWITWDLDHSVLDHFDVVANEWDIDNFTGGGMGPLFGTHGDTRRLILTRLRNESPEYRERFVARFTEVLNHELTPKFMTDLIDRYERTSIEFGITDRRFIDILRSFSRNRPAVVRKQLDTHFGAGPSYALTVRGAESLGIKVDGREIGEGYSGRYFAKTPARIEIDPTLAARATWLRNGVPMNSPGPKVQIALDADQEIEIVIAQ